MRAPVLAAAIAIATAAPAAANPRALPFTYTTDTRAAGSAELEQTVDVTPVRALSTQSGAPVWYLASALQTELEIGLTDRLELGLYVTVAPSPGPAYTSTAQLPGGTGLAQRLRYTLAPAGAWPVDVGVYGELAENERELELEAKVLLHRRVGPVRVAANLWAEYELYFQGGQRDLVLNPTLGATYELSPRVHVGLDSWLRVELPHPKPAARTFGLGPAVYAGPAVMVGLGRAWWTTAAYARVSDRGHDLMPGEPYGALWVRTMIGYDL